MLPPCGEPSRRSSGRCAWTSPCAPRCSSPVMTKNDAHEHMGKVCFQHVHVHVFSLSLSLSPPIHIYIYIYIRTHTHTYIHMLGTICSKLESTKRANMLHREVHVWIQGCVNARARRHRLSLYINT